MNYLQQSLPHSEQQLITNLLITDLLITDLLITDLLPLDQW